MIKQMRRTALAAGFAALSLASSASWAASNTYEFKTFFDTSTTKDLLDTKTLDYSVATLTVADITGGVQLTLSQLTNDFPAKSGGTYLEALWLNSTAKSGVLKSVTGPGLAFGSGYTSVPLVKDAGYKYNYNVDFKSKSFAEGQSATLTILGKGLTASTFNSTPMLDLGNVNKPYTGFLGLNSDVHFIGKLVPTIPEPSTYALMGLGLVGLALVRRRKAA
jgi:hypothetical protein